MDDALIEELRKIVGMENVSISLADREAYAFVSSGQDQPIYGKPDIVILPSTAEQVSAILSLANKHRMPVLARGQATGFQGENIPQEGGILLDMSLLDRFIEINEDNMVVVVEAGCTINRLYYELDKRGLTLPIRTWFAPNMQVGGLIANNGVGDFSSMYGRMADQTNALEVVLATGEIVRLGSWAYGDGHGAYTRYPGGPGLVGLLAGSAGLLGIITKVALRLIDKREFVWYRAFGWARNKIEAMSRFLYELQRYGISSYHLQNYWCCRGAIGANLVEWPAQSLGLPDEELLLANLIQVEKNEEILKVKEKDIIRMCERNQGVDLGGELCKAFHGPPYYAINLSQHYKFRPGMLAPAELDGMNFIELFYVHPTLALPAFWDHFEAVIKKFGFWDERRGPVMLIWGLDPYAVVAYPTFGYRPEEPDEVARFREAYKEIMEGVLKLKGVSYTLGSFLPREYFTNLGPTYELIKSIKRTLDPNDILNRGQLKW